MLSPKCTFKSRYASMTITCFHRHTSGHEFVGHVIALGSNFLSVGGEKAGLTGRPELYSTLKVGDKVVSPFTVSCGECQYVLAFVYPKHPDLPPARPCRLGFSSRCAHSLLFGSPALEGGQAQYVRVPYAGGTLFRLDDHGPDPATGSHLAALADSSLLLLADILPTGYFAALQLLQHPKLLPFLSGNPYPCPNLAPSPTGEFTTTQSEVLNITLIGLGPVGIVCTTFLSNPNKIRRNPISFHSALLSVFLTSSGRTRSRTTGLLPSTRTKRDETLSRRSTLTSSANPNPQSIRNRPSMPSMSKLQRREPSPPTGSASMAS